MMAAVHQLSPVLVDLDVAKSHSRPHVSDDNPYSESQFKTMKYRPDFPARFSCIADARAHCQAFFGYMTPQAVHCGQAQALREVRQAALDSAFVASPRRFKGRRPQRMRCPPQPGSTRQHRRPPTRKHHSPAQQIHDAGCRKVIDTFRPANLKDTQ